MTREPNYIKRITTLLTEIHKMFPSHDIGRHMVNALDGSDLWGISDKQLVSVLQKYKDELDIHSISKEDDIDEIIRGGMNLNDILDEEDYGEDC